MKAEQTIDAIFPLTFALTLIGLVLSPLWLVFVPVLWAVTLAVCLLLDLILMYRILVGDFRPAGHFIPFVYYVVFSVFGLWQFNYHGLRDWWVPALLALIAFHVFCQYALPAGCRKAARGGHGGQYQV